MKRRRNGGLRKRCPCQRSAWPKCSHTWYFNFKPPGGPHYRVSLDRQAGRHIDSKSEAVLVASQIRTAILAGTFRPVGAAGERPEPAPAVTTFESYANDWLATTAQQNLKASTVRFYRGALKNHIVPLIGARPIGAITRADCRELIATVRAKGLRLLTVKGVVRTLSSVLSQAVEDGHLAANPALRPGRYLRRGDEPEPRIDPLSREEEAHLLATALDRFPEWYAFVLTGLRTGMRLGELLALQWTDIDWLSSAIHIERGLVRGKLTTPKNHQARRVDMSRQLRVALRLHLRRERAAWLEAGVPRPEWVFASAVGTPFDEANVRKALGRIFDSAGLRRRGPHQLRHTFASLLLQAGEPVTYVSHQLGHRDSAITLRVYAHWLPDTGGRRGVDLLDDPAFRKPAPVARRVARPRRESPASVDLVA